MDSSRFKFVDEESLGDERVYRYEFHVPVTPGSWWIRSESTLGMKTGKADEHGFFWIDARDLTLRRIDVSAADIPIRLPLESLRATVDYELTTIGSKRVLLPAAAVVRSQLKSEDLAPESHLVFNHCRAFSAESSVTFDGASHSDVDAKAKAELPRGLTIPIELSSTIGVSSTGRTDLLAAAVSDPVQYKGQRDHRRRCLD